MFKLLTFFKNIIDFVLSIRVLIMHTAKGFSFSFYNSILSCLLMYTQFKISMKLFFDSFPIYAEEENSILIRFYYSVTHFGLCN